MWISCEDEGPEYSSCEYPAPVMDWKGQTQLIMARAVDYMICSETKRVHTYHAY
jgi:hypothetical protein